MPYHISKSESCPSSKPYAVIKDADGEIMGCHESRSSAEDQLAAIHINEVSSWQEKMDEVMKEIKPNE